MPNVTHTLHSAEVDDRTFSSDHGMVCLSSHPRLRLAIPHGGSFAREPSHIVWSQDGTRDVDYVVAVSRRRAAILYPPYRRHVRWRGKHYRLWCPTAQAEIAAAHALFAGQHPRHDNPVGTILCLAETNEAGVLRQPLIGAALIGEIYHTNLVERRAFADDVLGADWLVRLREGRLRRDQVMNRLHLTGGKRFVIRDGYRFRRLGSLLAEHTAWVASTHRWPPADFVEVSRWMTESELFSLCTNAKDDFLTRSSYVPVPSWRWYDSNGRRKARPAALRSSSRVIPGYYYRAVGGLRDRSPEITEALEHV
jgi:hypothetical protein